jgi:hypothetical protein
VQTAPYFNKHKIKGRNMSFGAIETSDDEGRPIFLYAFNLGAAIWRYTSPMPTSP